MVSRRSLRLRSEAARPGWNWNWEKTAVATPSHSPWALVGLATRASAGWLAALHFPELNRSDEPVVHCSLARLLTTRQDSSHSAPLPRHRRFLTEVQALHGGPETLMLSHHKSR